ncbi:MAG: D-glycero-beta-D-manno-heptose 1-phosphate adenylyltransferase [Phycisphaerae bacterium]
MDALLEKLETMGSPRVALVGDFMLDRYVYGNAERISQEGPIPVLRAIREETRVGGAGNVAAGILALGGEVSCIGVVGQDKAGEELLRLLAARGAETASLLRLEDRGTTIKTRYVGLTQGRNRQQMLRVDAEADGPLGDEVRATLRAALRGRMQEYDVLAIEDYGKGVVSEQFATELIAEARKASCPVVVDPARIEDYGRYRGATLLTPNRFEAELASGVKITDDESLQRAAGQILLAADAEAVVITLDKEGAYLHTSGEQKGRRLPSRPRTVYDGTGAGDAVMAMLSVAIGEKMSYPDAVALTNVAGGLEVERFGVVPIEREEVAEELRRIIGLRGGKTMSRERLAEEVARRRERGETIVFTNGCFDLLHMGHVRYLQQARELGNCLIVAVNSDDSVRRLKGPRRPVISQDERAEMLGALECVDYVTIFDEDTPIPLLELLRPDVLAKGGTTGEVIGRDVVEAYGGKVLTLDKVEGPSTTRIIERIVESSG